MVKHWKNWLNLIDIIFLVDSVEPSYSYSLEVPAQQGNDIQSRSTQKSDSTDHRLVSYADLNLYRTISHDMN